ncbi:aminotransferase [Melanogaster broomeanus]|nr:aminotransferase [Melanogaster broomeanus]
MSFSLLCSTRFDPLLESFIWNNAPDGTPSPYLLLSYQFDRLLSSASLNQWAVSDSLNYGRLKSTCDKIVQEVNGVDGKAPLKIRVVVTPSGAMEATATPVAPLRYDPIEPSRFNPETDSHGQFEPILSIHIDTQPTADTVFMKTTNRQAYDDARARAGIPPVGAPRPSYTASDCPDDVILFNTSKAITESSICNVAFHRDGNWLTPPLTVGCISGVFRRLLLENGCVHEAVQNSISLDTVKDDEWVLVFNGVTGCRLGRVRRVQATDVDMYTV